MNLFVTLRIHSRFFFLHFRIVVVTSLLLLMQCVQSSADLLRSEMMRRDSTIFAGLSNEKGKAGEKGYQLLMEFLCENKEE
jgi:hypothetical protein